MLKRSDSFTVAALDVGTSKISALVADCQFDTIEVIALGTSDSVGVKRGVVTNIEAAVQSIQQAIAHAETMANRKIKKVYTGIAGSHIRSVNSYGTVSLDPHREVLEEDVARVMQAAQTVSIPKDQQLLHILSQEFIVDQQTGIQEPIGMSGLQLSVKAHIISGATNSVQNITKCIQKCGVQVEDIILEPLASSQAILTDDEKELGVCLLDIGGGTADIALFVGGAIQYTGILPVAGDHVTRDIAILLNTSTETAEILKRKYAYALPEAAGNDWIEISTTTDPSITRNIPTKTIAEVVGARYEELFYLARQALESRGYWNQFPVGLVLTGGGSHVPGVLQLAQRIFQVPVRQGFPNYHGNLSDVLHHGKHATGVGLIYHACQHNLQRMPVHSLYSMYQRMRSWLQTNF